MIKISVVSGSPDARTADLLVYPGFAPPTAAEAKGKKEDKEHRAPSKKGKKASAADKKARTEPGFGRHLAQKSHDPVMPRQVAMRTVQARDIHARAPQRT